MRRIQVEDGLGIRFPDRSVEFDDGVEIGIVAALLAVGAPFERPVSGANLETARALAAKLGFRVSSGPYEDGSHTTTFSVGRARPTLKLVSSEPAGSVPPAKASAGPAWKPALVRAAAGAP